MYLKSLTLTGFKSFQKKTKIDFCRQVNGIVGPNGSGKSNILDAIRFAMGEQSGKSFRGNTMKDVIFSGSETQSAVNRAKVELVLDNSDHLLAEFGDQVEVSRTIYRDGTSDYEINKQNVRQKDVQSLFLGAGLGRDTMAFINQGKVQNIIDSDPIARRGVFEEVAGVYKYKLNRREAINNLESTDIEVQRLKDLLFELNNNLGPLEIESKRATEYANLKDLYDRLYIFSVVNKVDELVNDREQKEKEQSKLREEEALLNKKITDKKNQQQTFSDEVTRKKAEQEQLQQKIVQNIKERDDLSSEHQVLITRKDQSELQLKEQSEQIEKLIKEEKSLVQEQGNVKRSIEQITDELADKIKEQSKFTAKAGESLEELNQQLDKYKEQYFDLLNQKTNLRNEINVLENSQSSVNKLIASYHKRLDEKSGLLSQLEQKKTQFDQNIKDQLLEQDKTAQQIEKLKEEEKLYLDKRAQLNQTISFNNNKMQLLKSQISDLQNQERSLNGVFEGVKAVVQNADQLGGIIGTIFQLVTVPVKYQKALSEALGTRFQNIVTVDESSAKRAISFLKKANKGRATFYPLDQIQEQDISPSLKESLAKMPGFLGVAIDLIDFDSKYYNVISNFFGKLIVATDLDQGTQIAHLTQSRYRIVTLEGDLINIGGSMTGGKSNTRSDYFRTSEIAEKQELLNDLKFEISKDQASIEELQKKSVQIKQQINEYNDQRKQEFDDSEKVRQSLAEINAQYNSVKDQIEELNLEIKAQEKQNQGADKLDDLKVKLADNDTTTKDLDQKISKINEQIEKRLRDDNSGERSELEANIATLRERKLNFKERLNDFAQQIKRNHTEQELTNNKISDCTDLIKKYIKQISELADKLEDSKNQEESLNQQKVDLVSDGQEVTQKYEALSKEIETVQKELDKKLKNLNAISIQLTRVKVQLDSLLDDLANDYEMTYEGARNFVSSHELTDDEQKQNPQNLQKKLRDFGNVNLEAINEYEQLKERVEFSEKQLSDVEQARLELQESIDKLDDQVRTLFKNAFDSVNSAFQEIYPAMFTGGSAELRLTDPNDLLKTGVEIVAAPPGKKSRSLSLLSGGEKSLSAITLLFAIIKVSTVPFSILDEVEAALDDANVDRFSQYLEQFNGMTQFIVITHRRSTMRAAQRLFGVTMIGTGISKMVSVKLDDELISEEQ